MNSIPPPGHDVGLEAVGAQVRERLDHRLEDHLGVQAAEARMFRRRRPRGHRARELLGRHPAMGGAHDVEERLLALGQCPLDVAGEQRLERLLRLPLWMFGRLLLHLLEREGDLEIERLLGPECAVVVEDGDPLCGRDEGWPARTRGVADELDQRLLGLSVVPGRQRVGLGHRDPRQRKGRGQGQHWRHNPAGTHERDDRVTHGCPPNRESVGRCGAWGRLHSPRPTSEGTYLPHGKCEIGL